MLCSERGQVPHNIDVENNEDFHRYYRHAYIGLRVAGQDGVVPLRVWDGGPDRSILMRPVPGAERVGIPDPYRVEWKYLDDNGVLGLPTLGMLNTGISVGYWSYRTDRDTNRGYRPERPLSVLFNGPAFLGHREVIAGTGQFINEVFNPTYYDFDRAMMLLLNGERAGCALGPDMGLFVNPNCPFNCLAFRGHTVGYVQPDYVRPRVTILKHYRTFFNRVVNRLPREVRVEVA